MKTISKLLASCLLLVTYAVASPVKAEGEKRIAFVVGNAAYQAGHLATSANDAGLIAQTLQAAGFDVAAARACTRSHCARHFVTFSTRPKHRDPIRWPLFILRAMACSSMAKTISSRWMRKSHPPRTCRWMPCASHTNGIRD